MITLIICSLLSEQAVCVCVCVFGEENVIMCC